jgi:hypothetical protein
LTPYSHYAESKSTIRLQSLKLIRPEILEVDIKRLNTGTESKLKLPKPDKKALSFKSTPIMNLKNSGINFDKLTIDRERDTDVHTVNLNLYKRSSSPTFGRDSYNKTESSRKN